MDPSFFDLVNLALCTAINRICGKERAEEIFKEAGKIMFSLIKSNVIRENPSCYPLTQKTPHISLASIIVLGALVFMAVFAPWITPYSPYEINVEERYKPLSLKRPFGTDHLGRDVFSRVIFGTRLSLTAGILIAAISVAIGWPLGVIAGYLGGKIDNLIMRITDMFLAFPSLVLALIVAFVLEPSLINSMIAISVTWWPWYARAYYGISLNLR